MHPRGLLSDHASADGATAGRAPGSNVRLSHRRHPRVAVGGHRSRGRRCLHARPVRLGDEDVELGRRDRAATSESPDARAATHRARRSAAHGEPGCQVNTLDQAFEAMLERVVRRVLPEVLAATRAVPAADELVTMETFARRRSISESTVRAAIRDGRLPAVKIGRAVRVRADAQIGTPAPSLSASTSSDTPRARAARILGLKP